MSCDFNMTPWDCAIDFMCVWKVFALFPANY